MAAKIALERLDEISEKFPVNVEDPETLVETAMTTLSSKMYVKRPMVLARLCAAVSPSSPSCRPFVFLSQRQPLPPPVCADGRGRRALRRRL